MENPQETVKSLFEALYVPLMSGWQDEKVWFRKGNGTIAPLSSIGMILCGENINGVNKGLTFIEKNDLS